MSTGGEEALPLPPDLFRPAGDLFETQPARLASDLLQPLASLRRPQQLTGGEPGLEGIDHVSLLSTVALDPGQIVQGLASLPSASEKTLQTRRRDAGFESDQIIHALPGALTDRLEPLVRRGEIFLCELDLHELELGLDDEIASFAACQNPFRTASELQSFTGRPVGLPEICQGHGDQRRGGGIPLLLLDEQRLQDLDRLRGPPFRRLDPSQRIDAVSGRRAFIGLPRTAQITA